MDNNKDVIVIKPESDKNWRVNKKLPWQRTIHYLKRIIRRLFNKYNFGNNWYLWPFQTIGDLTTQYSTAKIGNFAITQDTNTFRSWDATTWRTQACCNSSWPLAPTIVLTSPAFNTIHILWTSVSPVDLTWTTTRGSVDIATVEFFRWATSIDLIDPAIALWWVETYTDTWSYTSNTSFTATVTDDNLLTDSDTKTIMFGNYFYRWADPLWAITETEIEALENNTVKNTFPWVYAFGSELWSYKYFARPTRLWQPSDPTLDFIDNDTGFPIPFQLQWTVNVTNAYWYAEDYYVYRSVNVLWWALNIKVQP